MVKNCHSILCILEAICLMENFENNNNQNSDTEFDETQIKTQEVIEVSADKDVKKTSWKKELLDWSFSIVVALVLALLIRNYVFTLVDVDGSSMTPTLTHGDKLYVNRFMYDPEVGDIIILHPPHSYDTPYVKRIIALEGQVVNINPYQGTVSVDGEILDEPYTTGPLSSGGNLTYPYTVPEGHVFVLGDNRTPGGSSDSRNIGPIPVQNIMGKAIFRILPFKNAGSLYK